MNAPPDQRFGPKFVNLKKAVEALEAALVDPIRHPREMAGIIQNFEIVYEVAWTTLKLFLELEGHPVRSAKETFAKAYQLNYIGDEDIWMDMIKNRNLTVHTYNQRLAEDLTNRIRKSYVSVFKALVKSLQTASAGQ